MADLFYRGTGVRREEAAPLPPSRYGDAVRPEGYRAEAGLIDAVNVALLLNQPLLLTGEPGTGKTQLAASMAAELGLGAPLRFDTKSTSTARDLFYTMDAVGRFQTAQSGTATRAIDFITYNALGLAILHANDPGTLNGLLPEGFDHPGQRRSVVLIDEVDKAPRDFPNDILAELEEMFFRVPELGNVRVSADERMRPIVVLTSNSEKHLPDAFLRRTVFYDISFPDRARLAEILDARLGDLAAAGSPFVESALNLFEDLRRDATGLRKKPATAELIGWLLALRSMAPDAEDPLADDPERARSTISVLIKNRDDLGRARTAVDAWIRKRAT